MKKRMVVLIVIIFTSLGFILIGGKVNINYTEKAIDEGKIDVGKVPDMELGNRFHNIHNEILSIDCMSCHISDFSADYLYQRKYKTDVRGMPGPVDRGACLSCHREGGLSSKVLYGSAEN